MAWTEKDIGKAWVAGIAKGLKEGESDVRQAAEGLAKVVKREYGPAYVEGKALDRFVKRIAKKLRALQSARGRS